MEGILWAVVIRFADSDFIVVVQIIYLIHLVILWSDLNLLFT